MSAHGYHVGERTMKRAACAFEKEVMIAARLDQWTDSLRSHASMCPVCNETTRVISWMQAYSREHESPTLPTHRLIWLKAQYVGKQERFSKFDILALGGMSLIGVAGFVGLVLWQFPQLLSDLLHKAGRSFPGLMSMLSHSASLAVAAAVLIIVWVLTRDSFMTDR